VSATARRAEVVARRREAGSVGEQWTAALLAPLERCGWRVLHDRALPGGTKANADHVVFSPGGLVFLVDSKLWNKGDVVHARYGILQHGTLDRGGSIRSLVFETATVARVLGVPVLPVIAVHTAPVDGGGFYVPVADAVVGRIAVLPARDLVRGLVFNDGPPDPRAAGLVRHAERVLPPHG